MADRARAPKDLPQDSELANLRAQLHAAQIRYDQVADENRRLHRQVEELLRQAHSLQQQRDAQMAYSESLLAQIPAGVLIVEVPSGRVLVRNDQIEQILRTPISPTAGLQDLLRVQGFHQDGRPYQDEEWPLVRTIRHHETVTGEQIGIIRDGGHCGVLSVSSAPLRDMEGRVFAAVAVLHDVTALYEAREHAQQAHERMLGIFGGIQDVVIALDHEWRFTYVNPHATQLAGVPAEEVIGRVLWERFPHVAGLPDVEPHLRRAMTERVSVRFETSGIFTNRLYEVSVYPTREGLTIYGRDITDRKAAEEALQESQARLELAVEATHLGMFDWYVQTGQLVLSDRTKEHLGLPPDAHVDYDVFLRGLHPDDRPRIEARIDDIRRGGHDTDFSIEFRTIGLQDGRQRWILAQGRAIFEPQGRIARLTGTTLCITDRKRGEQEREQLLAEQRCQREFLETLVNTAAIGIAVLQGPEFRYVLANPAYRALCGDPQARIIGRTLAEVLPEVVAAWDLEELQAPLRTGRPDSMREVRIAPFGQRAETWWNVDRIPLPDVQGHIDSMLIMVQDVTEDVLTRRRIEEFAAAAETSRSKLEAVIDNIDQGIIITDLDGKIVTMNPAARAVVGVPAESAPAALSCLLDSLEVRDINGREIPPDDCPLLHVLNGDRFNDLELQARHRDTGQTWVLSCSGTPVLNRQGEIILAVLTLQDITGRKRVEEALRRSEERFRRLVEANVIGVIVVDEEKVTEANDIYLNMVGYSRDELEAGQIRWREMTPAQYAPQTERALEQIVTRGACTPFEKEYIRKDGTRVPVIIGISLLSRSPLTFIGFVLDLTERKRAEQQLQELNETLEQRVAERTAVAEQRAAQLQRLAVELTRVEEQERRRLAEVLHDHLQQLLVGAKFGTGQIRGQLRDERLQEALRHVDDLLDQSIRASRLLTVELSPPVLYQAGLPGVLQWLANWMHEKHGLQTQLKIDPAAGAPAEEIRVLLFQAVRELLLNVVKHAGVRQATVFLQPEDQDHVQVVVQDLGTGFDPARIDAEQSAGSGFGLMSIQERLGLLGGQMTIDSAPGAGTRIALVAPLQRPGAIHEPPPVVVAPPPGPEAPSPISEAGAPGGLRVLLADDHEVVRDGLAQLLQAQPGIQVVAQAADGQMALELARQVRPDVVLMDVTMPRLDGVEATRRLKSEMPEVQVIGLSMHAESDMAERMRRAGASDYLTKSAAPEALVAAIRAACPQPNP